MFGWEYPPYYAGGLGVVCEGICENLLNAGYNVLFVLPQKLPYPQTHINFIFADDFVDMKFKNQNPHFNSPYNQDKKNHPNLTIIENSIFPALSLATEPYSLIEQILLYGQAAEIIARKYSFDIIHAHDWLTYPAGITAKKASGKPLVVHVHNTIYDRGLGHASYQEKTIERLGLEYADEIIPVSNYTKNIIKSNYHIPANKITPIHNCIDSSQLVEIPFNQDYLQHLKDLGKKIVLSLGRITGQKGIEYLIPVAQNIIKKDPNIIFIITGNGDQRPHIINEIAKHNLSDNVIIPGWATRANANRYFHMADLFIMPSVSEPFGIVALESIIKKTPAIVSKTSGASEILPPELAIDFWDTDKMVYTILELLNDPKKYKKLLKSSEKKISTLTWNNAIKKLTDIYKKLFR